MTPPSGRPRSRRIPGSVRVTVTPAVAAAFAEEREATSLSSFVAALFRVAVEQGYVPRAVEQTPSEAPQGWGASAAHAASADPSPPGAPAEASRSRATSVVVYLRPGAAAFLVGLAAAREAVTGTAVSLATIATELVAAAVAARAGATVPTLPAAARAAISPDREAGLPFAPDRRASATTTPAPAAPASPADPAWRPEQHAYYRAIRSSLQPGRIVLAEASTGIGKSRVLAQLALDCLVDPARGARRVILATPTVALVGHLAAELRTLPAAAPLLASIGPMLGRAQFVDVLAVQSLLDQARADDAEDADGSDAVADGSEIVYEGRDTPWPRDERDALQAWLDAGGPCSEAAGTHRLHEVAPELAFLVDDALAVAPTLDAASIALAPARGGDGDGPTAANPGLRAFLRHRAAAGDRALLVTTHAMVAAQHRVGRRRAGAPGTRRTPPDEGQAGEVSDSPPFHQLFHEPFAVLLDEAHDFEQAMAGAFSRQMALSTVRRTVAAISATSPRSRPLRAAVAQAQTHVPRLGEVARQRCRDTPQWRADHARLQTAAGVEFRLAIVAAHGALVTLARALDGASTSARRRAAGVPGVVRHRLEEAIRLLAEAQRDGELLTLTGSDVRRLPSLSVGPLSLTGIFQRFWATVDRAVLASATLTVPAQSGAWSYDYLAGVVLAIPADRRVALTPIRPAWLTADVRAFRPRPNHFSALRPVTLADDEEDRLSAVDRVTRRDAQARWRRNVAQVVRTIRNSARGGTLVLLPSLADCEAIGSALRSLMDDGPVLVHGEHGMAALRRRFLASASGGARPVWCATGGAWTGLDLRDPAAGAPSDDRGLTDLVIPRIPWRSNRGLQHQQRADRSYYAEMYDVALRVRQGIGRLVRQPGTRDRRLWLLDSRVWEPPSGSVGYVVIRRIAQMYVWREF